MGHTIVRAGMVPNVLDFCDEAGAAIVRGKAESWACRCVASRLVGPECTADCAMLGW